MIRMHACQPRLAVLEAETDNQFLRFRVVRDPGDELDDFFFEEERGGYPP